MGLSVLCSFRMISCSLVGSSLWKGLTPTDWQYMTFPRNNGMSLIFSLSRPLLVPMLLSVGSRHRLRLPTLSSLRDLSRREDRLAAKPSVLGTCLRSNGTLLEAVSREKLQLSLMPA